jgi:membrane peptidoglycan carboxypeptidase
MGYSPDRAVGVWMGNADNTPMAEGTFSFAGSGPIWKAIMEAAHEGVEVHDFAVPEGVYFAPCAGRTEVFVEGTKCTYVPPEPSPTPTPSRTPQPTRTRTAPTPTAIATPTPTPVVTPPVTPVSTPSPQPTRPSRTPPGG